MALENNSYRVEVSRDNGAITRIFDKTAKLDLIREPRLADNFKFTLPLPGKEPWETIEANYILGKDQPLGSCKIEGQALRLKWDKPLRSRTGEKYDVGVTMGIELQGEAVRFTLRIDNQTRYKIGEVFFPILGGITGLGEKYRDLRSTLLVRPVGHGANAAAATSDIFVSFANRSEYGDQGPEQVYRYPDDLLEPWVELYNPVLRRSMYLGSHDRAHGPRVLHLELLPGNSGHGRADGNWPRPAELGGLAAGVLISYVDFPNSPPGKVYEPAAVVLQGHAGGWREGQKIYRKWSESR